MNAPHFGLGRSRQASAKPAHGLNLAGPAGARWNGSQTVGSIGGAGGSMETARIRSVCAVQGSSSHLDGQVPGSWFGGPPLCRVTHRQRSVAVSPSHSNRSVARASLSTDRISAHRGFSGPFSCSLGHAGCRRRDPLVGPSYRLGPGGAVRMCSGRRGGFEWIARSVAEPAGTDTVCCASRCTMAKRAAHVHRPARP